jgi:hypothetical protein
VLTGGMYIILLRCNYKKFSFYPESRATASPICFTKLVFRLNSPVSFFFCIGVNFLRTVTPILVVHCKDLMCCLVK